MVFGTFDGVHPGHLNFFRQARRLAARPFLTVSIARDANVLRIKKKAPRFSEKKRLALVEKTGLADRVILGGVRDHLPHILREKPDLIALGYDQRAYVRSLRKDLRAKGLSVRIVRLAPHRPDVYKNSLLKKRGG